VPSRNPHMTRRTTIAISTVAVVVLLGSAMAPVSLVHVEGPDGASLVCRRVANTTTIALTFTHSMYGGDVTEMFAPAAGDGLTRTTILADNAAAAEYYAWDGAVREVDGRYEVLVPDQVFGQLAVRVDRIGNHRLAIDGETYSLVSMVDGSARVWLRIVTRPLLTQVFWARC